VRGDCLCACFTCGVDVIWLYVYCVADGVVLYSWVLGHWGRRVCMYCHNKHLFSTNGTNLGAILITYLRVHCKSCRESSYLSMVSPHVFDCRKICSERAEVSHSIRLAK
jgi:hypothetical protein